MSDTPGYPLVLAHSAADFSDGSYPQQQHGAPAPGYLGQTWSSLLSVPALNRASPSFEARQYQPQQHAASGSGHGTPARDPTYSYASHSTTVSYQQAGRRTETRSTAQFAQYQAQRPGRFVTPFGSSPSTSPTMHHAQSEPLPPITAIPEYHHTAPAVPEYQGSHGSYSQAGSSVSPSHQHQQIHHSQVYQPQSHQSQAHNSQGQSQSHQPQSHYQQSQHAHIHHSQQHSQQHSQNDHQQRRHSQSAHQSTYPPTGPATFPSPTQSATVPDSSTSPTSTRPILRSPTSQARTSLHDSHDSTQQSFSQLRMFAHKFETERGSAPLGSGQDEQHASGAARPPGQSAQPQQSPQPRPVQPRPPAQQQAQGTATASPLMPRAQPSQAGIDPPAGGLLDHPATQRWSRQLLPATAASQDAQLRPPHGTVSPQALSTVPRPPQAFGSAMTQRTAPPASVPAPAPRPPTQADTSSAPSGQRPPAQAAPPAQRPPAQAAPPAQRPAPQAAAARPPAPRPPAARPPAPAPAQAPAAGPPAPQPQVARPPAPVQTAGRPPVPTAGIKGFPTTATPTTPAARPPAPSAGMKGFPTTAATKTQAAPARASAPTTPTTPNGTRLVAISASQVSPQRHVVNIATGHSEGRVRMGEMSGAAPVYVIRNNPVRPPNSQASPSSQAPQTQAPHTQAPATTVAPQTQPPATTVAPQTQALRTQPPATTVAPSAVRFGAGNATAAQARPPAPRAQPPAPLAGRPVPQAGHSQAAPSQAGPSSQPAPLTQPSPSTAAATQAGPSTPARPSSQLATAAGPASASASEPRRVGRPPGTGKLQIAAAQEREAAVRAAMLSEGIDPDKHPATLAAALQAAASATAHKQRARKSATPSAASQKLSMPQLAASSASQPATSQPTASQLATSLPPSQPPINDESPRRGPGRPPGTGPLQRERAREEATRAAIVAAGLDPDTVTPEVRASFEPQPPPPPPPPRRGRPPGSGKAQRERAEQTRAAIIAAGLDPDTVTPEVRATFEPPRPKKRGRPRKHPLPDATSADVIAEAIQAAGDAAPSEDGPAPPLVPEEQPAAGAAPPTPPAAQPTASPIISQPVARPPAPTGQHGPSHPAARPPFAMTLNDYVRMLPQYAGPSARPPQLSGQAVRPPPPAPSSQPVGVHHSQRVTVAMSQPVRPVSGPAGPVTQPAGPAVRQPAKAPVSQMEIARAIAAHQARANQQARASPSQPARAASSQPPRASPSQPQRTSARNSPRPLVPKNRAVVELPGRIRSAAPAPTFASSATPGANGTPSAIAPSGSSAAGAGASQTCPSNGASNGASKKVAPPPSAPDAPDPQAAAHSQPKRVGPINRAMVVVPITRKRRAELIARGVYDPFRDDADDGFERERVNRRPRAAHTVTKVISIAVPRGTALQQQRIREPEPIKDRFAYPPEPPMREPFKSILTRDSLLNRLGTDGVYVCEWKGCGAELACEAKLLRHVQARDHAGRAAFSFGNLVLYQCHWLGCDKPSFRTAGKLEQHILAKHVCEKIVCPYGDCGLRSSTISHLHRHVMRNHEDGEEPRPRVDCPPEVAPPVPEPLTATVTTVELTTQPAFGKSYRTERYQELAHAKVLKMCIAPPNPEIQIVHPPHMLEATGNEDDSLAATREASARPEQRTDDEGESEEESEVPFEEIVVEAIEVDDDATPVPRPQKRKRVSLPAPANKRAMARRTGGEPPTPRSSQRVAAQRTPQVAKVKAEPVRFSERQTARRTGPVASPIPVYDDDDPIPPTKDKGKGRARAPPLPNPRPVSRRRSRRFKRALIDCIEVPRIDTSGYTWIEV